MTKDQVAAVLGSPDTTSTIGGDAYYYISTTQKTVAFLKPREIDRQVVAVYFDGRANVQQVAHYGLKDGIVVNYYKGETPARGKDLGLLEQIFGNLANRSMFKKEADPGQLPGGIKRRSPLLMGEHRQQQQRHDIGDLDHRIHRRSGRVLVGIADRIAGHRRLVRL